MSLKAVVQYLDYRLKIDREQSFFREFVAENIATLAANMKTKERVGYTSGRDSIWGRVIEKDTRSASQIIDDTFRKHGLRLKKGGIK